MAPVVAMAYNHAYRAVISGDAKGVLEYWSPADGKTPLSTTTTTTTGKVDSASKVKHVKFNFKTQTDLFAMAKEKTIPTSICVSPDGERFVVSALDMRYRVFRFDSGKLTRKYDEALPVFESLDRQGVLKLDPLDFGKRCAVERELLSTQSSAPPSNAIFDESGHFIIYATMIGIKIVNIETNKLITTLGRVENTERFTSVALYQGIAKVSSQRTLDVKSKQTGDDLNKKNEPDPLIVCAAFKKQRFYYFSKHESSPDDNDGVGRDVFNEKPTVEDMEMVTLSLTRTRTLILTFTFTFKT
jgi:peptidylprolyl isomerase domain and WD repeat-containing protein 1